MYASIWFSMGIIPLPTNYIWMVMACQHGQLAAYCIAAAALWCVLFFFRNLDERYRFQRAIRWVVSGLPIVM
ncbi:uncharacterized protein BDW43DRAFT_263085 [Aspergillus alliaceus]|uniref:uncharacterized protein n=1 Tax=Petromyces alliaceus TaxID=209559 RepID=UPI0012A54871|nr:uncharacterized protein BDW43DRAFT_263085 [Aspergillus alliaceus]KAB8238121.1 hypothetical protein BDW43DRAFT_263085 [Aspergillus alliaceus]